MKNSDCQVLHRNAMLKNELEHKKSIITNNKQRLSP